MPGAGVTGAGVTGAGVTGAGVTGVGVTGVVGCDVPQASPVASTFVSVLVTTTFLSSCFVKCAEFEFVIRCSCLPCSTPTTCVELVTVVFCPHSCVTWVCSAGGVGCVVFGWQAEAS